MKNIHKLLIIAFLAAVMALAPQASAADIRISIGDRPYMTHGTTYWSNGYQWYWVPGHWGPKKKYWVKGHYVKRGKFHRHRPRILLPWSW